MNHAEARVESLIARVAATLRPAQAEQIQSAFREWSARPTESFQVLLRRDRVLDDKEFALIKQLVDSILAHYSGDTASAITELIRPDDPLKTRLSGAMTGVSEFGHPLIDESPGRYSRESEYRHGGMGRVLLAYDEVIGRDVAVKELLNGATRQGDSELLARFLQEARVTGQLEHPAIVPIYELGRRENGSLYYTMKYVKGRTLEEAIRTASSFEERLKLLPHFVDMCQALAYAHSRGVIHRDIKPMNVLVGEFGETVVIDWGLAKVKSSAREGAEPLEGNVDVHVTPLNSPAETQYGVALGTPAYMPPEQALGRHEDVDERSDVYALGAVLYELLTGQPPHSGRTLAELLHNVVNETPTPVRSIELNAPPDLCAICERALSKDPRERYATAAELAEDITRFQSGALVQAYQYGFRELAARFARRSAAVLITAGVAIVILVAIGVVSYVRVVSERDRAIAARTNERDARIAEEISRKAAERDNYVASISAAKNLAGSGLYERGNAFLWRTSEDLRSWEWGHILRSNNPDLATLSGHTGPVLGLAFNGDGSRLLSLADDRTVRFWDPTTGDALRVEQGHDRLRTLMQIKLVLAPGGDRAATISDNSDGTVGVWNLDTGERVFTLGDVEKQQAGFLAFSADGRKLFAGGFSGYLWDLSDGSLLHEFRQRGEAFFGAAFNSSGDRLVATTTEGRMILYDLTGYSAVWERMLENKYPMHFLFSKDESVIVAIDNRGGLTGFDARSADVIYEEDDVAWPLTPPRLLRGGDYMVTPGFAQGAEVRDIATGVRVARIDSGIARVDSLAYDEKSNRLALGATDGRIRVADVETWTLIGEFLAHSDTVSALQFSSDGKRLASGSMDRTVRIWPADPGAVARGLEPIDAGSAGIVATAIASEAPVAAVLHDTGMIDLWDMGSWQKTKTLNGSALPPNAIALSPDGSRLIIGSHENASPVLDTRTDELVALLYGHDGEVVACQFSPDGKRALTGATDRRVRLWNAVTGELISSAADDEANVRAVAFSPDGKSAAIGNTRGRVALWDFVSEKLNPLEPAHTGAVASLSYSGDGSRLASASEDGTVGLWNIAKRSMEHSIHGHQKAVRRVAFAMEDTRLFTAGEDGRVCLWDPVRGDEILSFEADGDPIAGVEWCGDEMLVAGSGGRAWLASADPYSRSQLELAGGESWPLAERRVKQVRNVPQIATNGASAICVIAPPDQVLRRFGTLWDSLPQTEWDTRAAIVSGSRARAAFQPYGLGEGDQVLEINSRPILNLSDLHAALEMEGVGQPNLESLIELRVRFRSDGTEHESRIRVQPRLRIVQEVSVPFDQAVMLLGFGIPMIAANAEGMYQMQIGTFGLWEVPTLDGVLDGIWVAYFENPEGPLSPASKLYLQGINLIGLKIYDRVIAADGVALTSIDALKRVADDVLATLNEEGRAEAHFEVYRGSFARVDIHLTIEPKPAL